MNRLVTLAAGSLLAVGCTDRLPTDVDLAAVDGLAFDIPSGLGSGSGRITVMTRNIYVGANVDRILSAPLPEIPTRVSEAFQEFLSTDLVSRMAELALEIEQTEPHLIGLQEVSLLQAFFPTGVQQFDFLSILMSAIADRGLDYRLVAQIVDTDVLLPADPTVFPGLFGVRLVDSDAVLARGDVETSNVEERNYQAKLVVPGTGLEVLRGFAAVDAKVGLRTYRFVTTHLEPVPVPPVLPIQLAQAQELVLALSGETLPIIITGDFNTPAHLGRDNAPTYDLMLDAGYIDVWTRRARGLDDPGFTCCHDLALRNPTPAFDQRIDLVFARNPAAVPPEGLAGVVNAIIVGDEQETRDLFGLWPSDHGGVAALLQMPVPTDVGGN